MTVRSMFSQKTSLFVWSTDIVHTVFSDSEWLLWKLIWFSLKVSITVFLHKSQTRTQGKRNQVTTDPWVRLESRLTELWNIFSKTPTAKNTVISPNFLVWKFCGKAQFPQSFGRIEFVAPFKAYINIYEKHCKNKKQRT